MNRELFTIQTLDTRNTLGVIRYDGAVVAGWSRDETTNNTHVACSIFTREWRGTGLNETLNAAINDMCNGEVYK